MENEINESKNWKETEIKQMIEIVKGKSVVTYRTQFTDELIEIYKLKIVDIY